MSLPVTNLDSIIPATADHDVFGLRVEFDGKDPHSVEAEHDIIHEVQTGTPE